MPGKAIFGSVNALLTMIGVCTIGVEWAWFEIVKGVDGSRKAECDGGV